MTVTINFKNGETKVIENVFSTWEKKDECNGEWVLYIEGFDEKVSTIGQKGQMGPFTYSRK